MSPRLSVCSLILCCVVLTGCKPEVTRSSENSVVVKSWNGQNIEEVLDLAEAECSKHGKSAVLINKKPPKLLFNCV